jgi:hypothetical protein
LLPTDLDLIRFLATSAEDVNDCCDVIRANDLELVAVELYAAPKDSGAAAELLLVFGQHDAEDGAAA